MSKNRKESLKRIWKLNSYTKVFKTAILVYVILALLILLVWCIDSNIFIALILLLAGNFLLTIITQCLHFFLGSPHVFDFTDRESKTSFIVRIIAGFFEMIFYVFLIVSGLLEILVGFLIIKSLSVWNPKDDKPTDGSLTEPENNSNIEGGSTGILRIAIVLSLLISIGVSIYLLYFSSFTSSYYFEVINTTFEKIK